MARILNTTEEIIGVTLKILGENGKWMTASEIINWGNANGMMEAKDAPRQADAHPIYRVLTGMMRTEENRVRGLERRIRTSGKEKGSYEYAYMGLYDGTKVLVDGKAMTPCREKVEIGGKFYSKSWLESHPDKWESLKAEAEKPKTLLETVMSNL